MFRWVRNRYELFKLYKQETALEKEWKRARAEAEQKKDPAIFENWENNYGDLVYADLRWSRKKIVSDALLREADELLIPRPLFADQTKWDNEEDAYGAPRGLVLTAEAMTELRASIRKEKKESWEVVESRVKLLGGFLTILTGLVGALIGLASVWKHK
jgi:hypothetical protein